MSGGHESLPLSDYDQLPLGSLATRLRGLRAEELQVLLDHENGHAHRAGAVTLIENRLQQLAAGAEPTEGGRTPSSVDAPPAAAGGSPVSPATSGPPMNPPSHGDPTNPAQPR